MILQFSIVGYEWVLGLSFMFGLSILFDFLTFRSFKAFCYYLTFFNGLMVLANLLELWTLILTIIISVVVMYFQITENRNGG